MKTVVLLGDGMGDYPLPVLGGRTPLQAAQIPEIRAVAGAGEVRLLQTVPDGMTPGSDVANLSIMGFDPRRYYTGRAPIEAAGAKVDLGPAAVAFRCNLVTITDGLIEDHAAGHISTAEARPIIQMLNDELGQPGLQFHISAGYRHLLVWDNGPATARTVPPHDVLGQPAAQHLPSGPGSEEIRRLMDKSRGLLAEHPVCRARRAAGKRAPTQIWLWGQGQRTQLPSYQSLFGLTGSVISAVDLVRGIGRLAGLDDARVPGATGFLDSNFTGKVQAALTALAEKDFVFVHVEAPDECGHMGDLDLKIKAIEVFDREVVGPVRRGLDAAGVPYRLIIATDHRTPVSVRNHTIEPVPVALARGPLPAGGPAGRYDEFVNGECCDGLAFEWMADVLRGQPLEASAMQQGEEQS